MVFPRKLALATTALVGLAAAPAHAAIEVTAYQFAPSDIVGSVDFGGFNIGTEPPPNAYRGQAGRVLATVEDTSTLAFEQIYTFCVDALTPLETGSPLYTFQPISAITDDTTKQEQLAALLSHASTTIAHSSTPFQASAGLQLAVWSVIYDAGDSGYDLTSSNFNTYGDFAVATGDGSGVLGQQYLDDIQGVQGAAPVWTGNPADLEALVSANDPESGSPLSQDLITLAVPEPATWLTMILGFGMLGAALRRRKGLAVSPLATN